MEKRKTQIFYHCDSRKICIMVVLEETCVVAWALICEREDISELECLMVSGITCFNDYIVLIGRGKSAGKRKTKLVFLIGQTGLWPF